MSTPESSPRMKRIEGLLTKKLADYIHRELNDPRISAVSITYVRVSRDISHAKVYCTCGHDAKTAKEAISGLNRAKGHLRSLLAKSAVLKKVPELRFVLDETTARSAYLNALIDTAVKDIDGKA